MYTRMARIILMMLMVVPAVAQQIDHSVEHGGQLYHRIQLEVGTGVNGHSQQLADWVLDGWIGSDENKLRFDGNGRYTGGSAELAEVRLMYSRNISRFWDAQIGVHQELRPDSISYLAVGVEGLAPYFFETDLHVLMSEQGDVSMQIRQENELLLTQRLIMQPYMEVNLYLQDIPQLDVGAGLAQAEVGLQLRYEFTRKFAPYASIGYERKFGKTASTALANGVDRDNINAMLGVRLLF